MKKLMLVVMVLSLASMAVAFPVAPVDPGPGPWRDLPKDPANSNNRLDLPRGPDYTLGTADDTYHYIVSANAAYETWARLRTDIGGDGPTTCTVPAGTTLTLGTMRNMGTINIFGDVTCTSSDKVQMGNGASSTLNLVNGTLTVNIGGALTEGVRFPDNSGGIQTMNIWDCIFTVSSMNAGPLNGDSNPADSINFAPGGNGLIVLQNMAWALSQTNGWNPYNWTLVPGQGEIIKFEQYTSEDIMVIYSDVPEPATMLLLGLGGLLLRRKRS